MVGHDADAGRGSIELVAAHAFDHGAFTATEVMAATGLTRATVLKSCDELAGNGWIRELDDARAAGDYRKGRPARRYELAEDAAFVVGLDVGQHRVAALVANLRGTIVARAETADLDGEEDPARRLATSRTVIEHATKRAGIVPRQVLVTTVGVPAPVDAQGRSPRGDHDYWARMNPGFAEELEHWGEITLENDANLAAVAELTHGATAQQSLGVLLAGERFGAGLIVDGVLLHGANGGAGELRMLDMVEGVGSSKGLDAAAREWVHEDDLAGVVPQGSPLATLDTDHLDVSALLAASSAGDPYAQAIVDRLGERLGRVCAVLTSLLDVEEIVVAGGRSIEATPVIARAQEWMESESYAPTPSVRASILGTDVVALGAVARALATLRSRPARFAHPLPR
ncbi:ROK family protein [Plantibacter flavus]|uniref:ROK family transcriptional regulator n=1 Tax=Plantibacter flavus TaxID=150123 RepID=UPI003F1470A9